MESSQTMQHFGQHNLGPNGFNTMGANGFNGVPMANGLAGGFQPFAVGNGQPWQQQANNRCGGFAAAKLGGHQGFPPHHLQQQQQMQANGQPAWGVQRKRSLDDEDEDCMPNADWCMTKRQRPSLGDVEAQVTIYNSTAPPPGVVFDCATGAYTHNFQAAHQMAPSMQCDDGNTATMNTSAVEHATSVTASRGYDDMYSYNLMLSEVYGC